MKVHNLEMYLSLLGTGIRIRQSKIGIATMVFALYDCLVCSIFLFFRYYSDYGDIIKETISRSRHVNKLACAQTLALSLMTVSN